jgi:thiamine phosphate synthase YjbQ (UPF0047 family)
MITRCGLKVLSPSRESHGRLDFGTWERIFYGEFDDRRWKQVLVKMIGESV